MAVTVRDYLHKKQGQPGLRFSIASSVIQSETPVPTLANQEHRDSITVSSYSQSGGRYIHQEKGWVGEMASDHMRPHTPLDDEHDL